MSFPIINAIIHPRTPNGTTVVINGEPFSFLGNSTVQRIKDGKLFRLVNPNHDQSEFPDKPGGLLINLALEDLD